MNFITTRERGMLEKPLPMKVINQARLPSKQRIYSGTLTKTFVTKLRGEERSEDTSE